jgi:hypothetical protein
MPDVENARRFSVPSTAGPGWRPREVWLRLDRQSNGLNARTQPFEKGPEAIALG